MRKSIFTDFFYLCVAVFISAVICIGTVLLLVSEEHYKSNRFNYLSVKSEMIINTVRGSIAENGGLDKAKLSEALAPLSDTLDTDITLTDPDGVALVCSEASPCSHTDKKINPQAISRITEDGASELSNFNGYYEDSSFVFTRKINIDGEPYIILIKLRSNTLTGHMLSLVAALLISSALILSVAFAIVYTASRRLLSPIREMTMAAQRFGEGDFSEKLYVTDDNELGYLATKLNDMANSLEQLEETRKSFISNVSHELKTPMTTIGGFVDGILDGTIPESQHRHYMKIVSAEVGRLSRLVRSMLNISKYEAGELKLSTEDFDILPIILQTLTSFEKTIDEKNIDIQITDADGCRINADPDLTGQVIYNLIENAVKFVNKGGYIRFSFGVDGDMCSVSIRNSGEGLKKQEISRVFDRFYKTDESRGIDPGGVGLGLSIVSSIIKLHNGKIVVSSEPDQYTEFTFSLRKSDTDRR
ncbi:MAG: HAMP domain-containing histidine kinase [Oscillospiraceae bacterium]|nr:HAMP domain-containing histidine kinase [Oscillospiraceae bacterium]